MIFPPNEVPKGQWHLSVYVRTPTLCVKVSRNTAVKSRSIIDLGYGATTVCHTGTMICDVYICFQNTHHNTVYTHSVRAMDDVYMHLEYTP